MKGNKTVVLTGGGSAGHVTPNLALASKLKERGWNIEYIGSGDGIERKIVEDASIPFHPISSGKLRRYFDWKNFKDPFKVMKGVYDAYRIIRKLKPAAVFSKGGFVSVPVVAAGWMSRVPVVIHESDMTPGLANKLSMPFASKVCVTFPETAPRIRGNKAVCTGLPIRKELFQGNAAKGRDLCGFHRQKPVLFVMGGSLGARSINEAVRGGLPKLLERFQIVHICGKGNEASELNSTRGYRQFEFVREELPHLLAMADLVVSRAGSTSIFELLSLRKPMLLIPLGRNASRGDQILNAESFRKSGYAHVLEDDRLSADSLVERLEILYAEKDKLINSMSEYAARDSVTAIADLIEECARSGRKR
jgi:UDP-N-acetylglucosamine--N-acetylmuramyl-(pentapeptide) pyrophosphoryl-undecaprenol N-acetylglucosamine transferase